jgi:serine/threonine-protein kinase RIO1
LKEIKRVSVEELYEELKKSKKKISSIVFDGVVTQRLVDLCKEKEIETIVGAKISDLKYRPKKPQVYNFA